MLGMKCEICGVSDFVKTGGLFVCQNCKMKYTVQEAKKLFVDDKENNYNDGVSLIRNAVSGMADKIKKDFPLHEEQASASEEFDMQCESQKDIAKNESVIVSEQTQGNETYQTERDQDNPILESVKGIEPISVMDDQPQLSSDVSGTEYCAICHKPGCIDKELVLFDKRMPLCLDCKQKITYAQKTKIDKDVQREFFVRQIKEKNASQDGMALISSIYGQNVEELIGNAKASENNDTYSAESAYPLKWHNFLMVVMVLGGIIAIVNGLNTITGMAYLQTGYSSSQIYSFYPELKSCDMVYGIITIAIGIFEFVVRSRLNKFKSNGPSSLTIMYVIAIVSLFIYLAWASSATRINMMTSSNLGSLVSNIIFLIVNGIYYSKRRELFVY